MAQTTETTRPEIARSESAVKALLRHWRQQRGLSQLDLSIAADVSARHISFMETGRSQPSVEMLLHLGEVLDIPLRDRNEMLRAGGYPASYPEPTIAEVMESPIGDVLRHMLEHHEPFPMMVIDRHFHLIESNLAGQVLLSTAGVDPSPGLNLMRALFGDVAKALIDNWEDVAGHLLRRMQREVLAHPTDEHMADLLRELLASPGIPSAWRTPDLSAANEPMLTLIATLGDVRLRLLTTLTQLSAPNQVTLEEIHIESYLPLDNATRAFFEALA